ncbi:uncharacterized protein TNCV_4108541 [Trichonephila clavipes]|nr:uncharacterized protein TNCV_4108541 [Trichonephila clavipes]
MTGHIYRDVFLEQRVRFFPGAKGAEFLFMDDNARPHHERQCARPHIVDECLQSEDITRLTNCKTESRTERGLHRGQAPRQRGQLAHALRRPLLNDDEIVTSVEEEPDDETDEVEDTNNNESSKGPSNAGAFPTLEIAMKWYRQQSECCPTQLLLLKRIRDLAVKKRWSTTVQRKLSDYFPQ